MSEEDRVAIHEVMEQQTVTIAKAGIHTSLNARCSVIAAANPIYGEYQKDLAPTKNIGLPDSLLSRFDLLFIVMDEKDSALDKMIAERVTRNHRFISQYQSEQISGLYNNDDDFVVEPENRDNLKKTEIFEKFNSVLHSAEQQQIVTQDFLKKYIMFAKRIAQQAPPQLSDESIDLITKTWIDLRQKDKENAQNSGAKNLPITIRSLETLIRLATAHAKLRLSKQVQAVDCNLAANLLHFSLFNEKIHDDVMNNDYLNGKDNEDKMEEDDMNQNLNNQYISQNEQSQQQNLRERRRSTRQTQQQQDKQLKRLKIQNDGEEIDKYLVDKIEIEQESKVSWDIDNCKFAYTMIAEVPQEQEEIPLEYLYERIQTKDRSTKGYISSMQQLKLVVQELKENDKLMQLDNGNIIRY